MREVSAGGVADPDVDVAEIVRRVREFPPLDYRRWPIIEELGEADQGLLLAEAARLLASADAQSMIVGAQILDPYLTVAARAADEGARESGRLAGADVLEPLLRNAVDPAQDPSVIATALPACSRFHTRDADPGVRQEAAEGLLSIFVLDEAGPDSPVGREVAACLLRTWRTRLRPSGPRPCSWRSRGEPGGRRPPRRPDGPRAGTPAGRLPLRPGDPRAALPAGRPADRAPARGGAAPAGDGLAGAPGT